MQKLQLRGYYGTCLSSSPKVNAMQKMTGLPALAPQAHHLMAAMRSTRLRHKSRAIAHERDICVLRARALEGRRRVR